MRAAGNEHAADAAFHVQVDSLVFCGVGSLVQLLNSGARLAGVAVARTGRPSRHFRQLRGFRADLRMPELFTEFAHHLDLVGAAELASRPRCPHYIKAPAAQQLGGWQVKATSNQHKISSSEDACAGDGPLSGTRCA